MIYDKTLEDWREWDTQQRYDFCCQIDEVDKLFQALRKERERNANQFSRLTNLDEDKRIMLKALRYAKNKIICINAGHHKDKCNFCYAAELVNEALDKVKE